MIGKRSTPVIGKITGTCIPAGTVESVTSPRSPLDFKLQSPRGLKCYDCGGVGLAIVAALEKSGEIPAKKAVYNRNSNRSRPIPVISARLKTEFQETEMVDSSSSSFEEYTVVTCRAPGNKTYTRVYGDERTKINQSTKCSKQSVFDISPARFGDFPAYPDSDFLSSCHLCQKKLHGKDIYMYRGEKAFCSTECRYRQIVIDEHKEKCSSEAPRSVDISSSPYANGQIFSTGILAI